MLDRILGSKDHKRLRQVVSAIFDRRPTFGHCFQQTALRFRSSSVYFICQNDIRKDWSGFEFELSDLRIVNCQSDDIRRQQIAGELDSLKRTVERSREGLRKRSLADARDVFEQQ